MGVAGWTGVSGRSVAEAGVFKEIYPAEGVAEDRLRAGARGRLSPPKLRCMCQKVL